MSMPVTRRELLRLAAASGVGAGLATGRAAGAEPTARRPTAHLADGKVIQPEREVPLLHQTDVLVVGGGPAGTSAAIAARRTGARVALVERYGHMGGLWSGGFVVLIIGHRVGELQVSRGIGEEMMQRLDRLDRGICRRGPGQDPIVDVESLKYVLVDMVTEAQADVFLHCWGVDAIMEGNAVRGAVFESKSGRQAILAKVVIDATGDGDLYAAAGAEHVNRPYRASLLYRVGNLDKIDLALKSSKDFPKHLRNQYPIDGVTWNAAHAGEIDGLDVRQLTKQELALRRQLWKRIKETRATAGYEPLYLIDTAPQLGIRVTRVLRGEAEITADDYRAGRKFSDVVAVGGIARDDGAKLAGAGPWQVPYGALLPRGVENLLAAGRCISFDKQMTDLVRLIPNCWSTGQAAGVAAAVAVADGCTPRNVDVSKVQKILREQDAYLG